MPVIMYNKKNTLTLSTDYGADGEKPAKYRFLPGPNEVDDELWKNLQKTQSCKNFLGMGALRPLLQASQPVVEPAEPGAKRRPQRMGESGEPVGQKQLDSLDEADVTKIDGWAAKELIQGVVDMVLLRKFRKQERGRKGAKPRKMVLDALTDQIRAVEGSADLTGGKGGAQSDIAANAGRQ